ncbi:efflux RND transporter periplasmic adaptor subunit [Pseudoxanthomonas wuyuanensis]|uniref:Membrane fusion protein, multidrug efflux system n=1 Tax=Pseudoxanthomonas wuyuanensis TaxID=1073196 RepID=A0A286D3S1_9GAMM|nr:efflux RND transporter periplasmic adaptor subunit [Pseudoxanthomonas wuyuanensis]SOD53305.1 membrane fusion protein, multidrug efflux system [Pseudoxanthomonas wuyuanensis]
MFSGFGIRAACAVVLAMSLAACGRNGSAQPAAAAAAIPVTTQVVQTTAWNDTLQALGTAKARESVTLTAKVSEIVQEVHFESGQDVSAGERLITLKGDAQQAALVQAQATYLEADQLYRRQKELADQQLVARSALDTQLALRNTAEARVRQMRAEIGDRSVRAPFSGVLGIRQVSPGSLITPTTVIATLDDISRMYVDFQVPEAALASVGIGNTVTATAAAYPGRQFEGTVQTIDARIDPGTRAVTVRAEFPNPDRDLRPGMLMDVRLFRPERQALVIPEIAVVQVGRDLFVYRVKADGSVEQAPVSAGVRREGKVEITQGIAVGERIVVDGTGKLRPGVKVAEAEPRPRNGNGAGKAPQPARQG